MSSPMRASVGAGCTAHLQAQIVPCPGRVMAQQGEVIPAGIELARLHFTESMREMKDKIHREL